MNTKEINTNNIENADLSIIVVYDKRDKGFLNALNSLLPPYQIGLEDKNVEIIVIDNCSGKPPDFAVQINKINYVRYNNDNRSHENAVNYGISIAKSDLIGILLDGARIVTPGLCREVISANNRHQRSVISVVDYYLGPDPHFQSLQKGYDEFVENALLEEINWIDKGYDLFLNCCYSHKFKDSSKPISESSLVFMNKDMWNEVIRLDSVMADSKCKRTKRDAIENSTVLNKVHSVKLVNEATFRQLSINPQKKLSQLRKNNPIYKYFSHNIKDMVLFGEKIPQLEYLNSQGKTNVKYPLFTEIQTRLNNILAILTDGLVFGMCEVQIKNTFSSLIDSPVILIGRGGSGTRILSRLIQDLGLFLGNELNDSDDSQEWVDPIYNLIISRKFIAQNSFSDCDANRLRFNAIKVLKKVKRETHFIWGFKLPETMLCLPELHKTFPNVKFIHLTRHPISLSLRRSHVTSRLSDEIGSYVLEESYKQSKIDFTNASKAPEYINNALSWYFQLYHVNKYAIKHLNRDNYFNIKYEEICADPIKSKNNLIGFLGLELKKDILVDHLIDKTRINKINYQDNTNEVNKIWEICGGLAEKLGYKKMSCDNKFENKKVIFILGMHRNGTSAITRVMNLLGASLPNNLMQSNSDNQNGYWESKNIVSINNQLLKLAKTSWFDSNEIPADWFKSDAVSELKNSAIELLYSMFKTKVQECLVLKDPRICRLLPFWHSVLKELAIEFNHVIIFRHPEETYKSFKARYDNPKYRAASIIHAEKLNLLWARYVLNAEYYSRDFDRIFINYQDLIDFPSHTLLNLEKFINRFSSDLSINDSNKDAIEKFISQKHQHHKNAVNQYQSKLELSNIIFKKLSEYTKHNQDLDVSFLENLRNIFNLFEAKYSALMHGSQNQIHICSPWYAEISNCITKNLMQSKPNIKVMFFSGEPTSKGHTYRVVHQMEALSAAGIKVSYQSLEDGFEIEKLKEFSAIIVFRVPWGKRIQQIYKFCKEHKVIRIFDVDDLVFRPELMTIENWDFLRLKNNQEKKQWDNLFINYSKTLKNSDHVIVTTKTLANEVKVINKPVEIIYNGIGQQMLLCSRKMMKSDVRKPSDIDGFIRLGYASGSPTHQKDFEEIYLIICQLLKQFDNIKLTVVGHLNLKEFPLLMPYKDRIEKRPLVEHMDLFAEYHRFDINLAPLQSNNLFCEGKSQLKYHESGLVAVPTVSSATQPYCDAIHLGITGYYANNENDWIKYLKLLIKDKELRNKVGKSVQNHVIAKFGPKAQSMLSSVVMNRILNSNNNVN